MRKQTIAPLALTTALAGGAAAAPITLNAGESAVFNFANPGPLGALSLNLSGFVAGQSASGTSSYHSGQNLAGDLIYVDNQPASYVAVVDTLTQASILDGFSVLIEITAGSFTIDPVVFYSNGTFASGGQQRGTLGDRSGLASVTTPTPGTSSVPEPGSLALAGMAMAGLVAARRRAR